jgi:hypothetical protein
MKAKTKICGTCGYRKQIVEFNFKNTCKGTRQSYCRDCGKEYTGSHYQRNRDYYIEKARKNSAKARKSSRERVVEYLKTHPCVDCGETEIVVLQFDHVKGEKRQEISYMVRKGASWNTIEIEIAKCEVRCANCHARRTARQRGFHAYLES